LLHKGFLAFVVPEGKAQEDRHDHVFGEEAEVGAAFNDAQGGLADQAAHAGLLHRPDNAVVFSYPAPVLRSRLRSSQYGLPFFFSQTAAAAPIIVNSGARGCQLGQAILSLSAENATVILMTD
jgi:hypothetical protein